MSQFFMKQRLRLRLTAAAASLLLAGSTIAGGADALLLLASAKADRAAVDSDVRGAGTGAVIGQVIDRELVGVTGGEVSLEFFTSLLRAARFGGAPAVDEPYTLFLPADRAFERFSGQELSALIHHPDTLRALVESHIAPGRVSASDLMAGQTFAMLDGTRIDPRPGPVPEVNGARVIATEEVDGGIVHIVDRVL